MHKHGLFAHGSSYMLAGKDSSPDRLRAVSLAVQMDLKEHADFNLTANFRRQSSVCVHQKKAHMLASNLLKMFLCTSTELRTDPPYGTLGRRYVLICPVHVQVHTRASP